MPKAMTNMSLFAIALVINKSISLIMLPVLPQFLTPEQMGKLELLTSFGVVTALLASMAMHEALYRFAGVEKDKEKQVAMLNHLYSLSITIAAVIGLILLFIILVAPIPSPFSQFEFIVLIRSRQKMIDHNKGKCRDKHTQCCNVNHTEMGNSYRFQTSAPL